MYIVDNSEKGSTSHELEITKIDAPTPDDIESSPVFKEDSEADRH